MSQASSNSSSLSSSSPSTATTGTLPLKCQAHNAALTRYCAKCQTLICASCSDHKDHEQMSVTVTVTPAVEAKASTATATATSAPKFAPVTKFICLGGLDQGENPSRFNDVYDVKEDKWESLKANLEETRRGHVAVSLPEGIYVWGCNSSQGGKSLPNLLEYYDYDDKKFVMMPNGGIVSRDLLGQSGVCVNGFLYTIGGCDQKSGDIYKTSERFEVKTKTWSTIAASMNDARQNHCCVVGPDGQHIYAIGGATKDAKKREKLLKSMEVFDVKQQVWEKCAPMALAREHFSAVLASDGRIYVMGGVYNKEDDSRKFTDEVEIYDPIKNTWSKGVPMPEKRWRHSAIATEDGKIYTIGGGAEGSFRWTTPDVYMFDVVAGTWTKKANMPHLKGQSAVVPFNPLPED